MANRFRGEVSISVEGRSFTLRMDFNAMAEFEDATGRAALDVFQEAEKGTARMSTIRAIVFAALTRHHPDATVQDAGDILSEDPGVVQRLMAAAAPDGEPGKARAKPGKARAGAA